MATKKPTAAAQFGRIAPTVDVPHPLPPTSGFWIEDEEGGLTPADEATARTADLLLTEPTE